MSSSEGATLHPCNVCGEPTHKTCASCGVRRYCSRECQKKDWKLHKQYCAEPDSELDTLDLYERACASGTAGFTFNAVMASARRKHYKATGDSKGKMPAKLQIEAFQELLEQKGTPYMKVLCSSAPPTLIPNDDSWNLSETLKEYKERGRIQALHMGWTYSFQTNGKMHESGKLKYQVACVTTNDEIRAMETIVVNDPQRERPGRKELEYLVFKSICDPLPGNQPGYPQMGSIMFAHRWTSEAAHPVMDILLETLHVICTYESRSEARFHSANNDTDRHGFNF